METVELVLLWKRTQPRSDLRPELDQGLMLKRPQTCLALTTFHGGVGGESVWAYTL